MKTRTAHNSQYVDVPRYHILANESLCLVCNTFLDDDQDLTGCFWLLLLHIQRTTVSHCRLDSLSGVVATNAKFSIKVI